jgi:hypothetical protein
VDVRGDHDTEVGDSKKEDSIGITAPWNIDFSGDLEICIPDQYFRGVPITVYTWEQSPSSDHQAIQYYAAHTITTIFL